MARGTRLTRGALFVCGAALCVAAGATGCTGEVSGGDVASQTQSQWQCQIEGDLARCSAAIPKRADEIGAYACQLGDSADTCPAKSAVEQLHGAMPAALWGHFGKLPWACLTTGAHERECTRSIEHARAGERSSSQIGGGLNVPGSGSNNGAGGDDNAGSGGNGGFGGLPGLTPPNAGLGGVPLPKLGDCSAKSWEQYFCKRATASYRASGVEIDFPCKGVFNANGSLTTALRNTAGLPTTPGAPSCAPGEWDMRAKAWIDAVGRGCLSLSMGILVMCQQAVNHAPTTKKCNLTGTW